MFSVIHTQGVYPPSMIDFATELAKFDFISVDAEFIRCYSEAAPLAEALAGALKRMGRELNQANLQMEEVLALCAEQRETENALAEQKKEAAVQIAAREEEIAVLIEALLAALDRLEDIYRYTAQHRFPPQNPDRWAEQIKLLWDNTAASLPALGLSRIEGEGAPFDARIHAAVHTAEDRARPNGTILDVLRCGYLYRSRLLRKAQVVVNKTVGGPGNNHEQHCGN